MVAGRKVEREAVPEYGGVEHHHDGADEQEERRVPGKRQTPLFDPELDEVRQIQYERNQQNRRQNKQRK